MLGMLLHGLWPWAGGIVLGPSNSNNCPMLWSEVGAAIKFLQKGKAAGASNILAKLVQSGGSILIDILTIICNKILQSGEWPTSWTQSPLLRLPHFRLGWPLRCACSLRLGDCVWGWAGFNGVGLQSGASQGRCLQH